MGCVLFVNIVGISNHYHIPSAEWTKPPVLTLQDYCATGTKSMFAMQHNWPPDDRGTNRTKVVADLRRDFHDIIIQL